MKNNIAQSGNVLFLILIAVALFATLSYAITQSNRGGDGSVTGDKARLKASELMQYASTIEFALNRVKVMNGCELPGVHDDFFGDPATNPGECNIFDSTNGGGALYDIPVSDFFGSYTNPPYPGKSRRFYNTMTVLNVATTSSTHVALGTVLFFFNIDQEICKQINKIVGVSTSDGEPPVRDTPHEGGYINNSYNGDVPVGFDDFVIGIAGWDPELSGKPVGCFAADRAGTDMGYHFYHIIEVR